MEKNNMYSMGNDYPVIKENLKLNSINRKSILQVGKTFLIYNHSFQN